MSNSKKDNIALAFPTHQIERRPVSPGEVLRDEILKANNLTQDQLADAMGVSRYSINQLVNERRNVTADMALRLGKATNTSAKFWLDLQQAVELYDAFQELKSDLQKVKVVVPTSEISSISRTRGY